VQAPAWMVLKGLKMMLQMGCKGLIGVLLLTHVPYDIILTATVRCVCNQGVHVTKMSMNVSKMLIYVIKYSINAFVTQAEVSHCVLQTFPHVSIYTAAKYTDTSINYSVSQTP